MWVMGFGSRVSKVKSVRCQNPCILSLGVALDANGVGSQSARRKVCNICFQSYAFLFFLPSGFVCLFGFVF